MNAVKTFDVPNFMLQKGGMLPIARLSYKTLGTLNSDRSNAVLVPSWYTGTHADTETFMTGTTRALDSRKYFLILTDLLGNGLSTSPSNAPAPIDRGRFPRITIYDNVRLQHAMISQVLGIETLRLVTGWSMGACQTYQWASQYPNMVKAACPIAGSARTASFNKVFLLSLKRALELDPAYAEGFYDRAPIAGLRAFASIYAGWGVSEPFFRTEAYRLFGATSHEEFVQYFWEPFFLKCDANNLLSQLSTWFDGDISANQTYEGNFQAALRGITARTIVMPVDNDRYFPPADAEEEVRHILNSECRTIHSIWGHMAPMNPGDNPAIDGALSELLG